MELNKRRARYSCSLALADPSGLVALTQGTWSGRIAAQPRGRHGFGYDPIFYIPRFGKTVGQLPDATKQRVSHRTIAARRLRPILRQLVQQSKKFSTGE
jgi:XTP/dITP diphosphohydrolase